MTDDYRTPSPNGGYFGDRADQERMQEVGRQMARSREQIERSQRRAPVVAEIDPRTLKQDAPEPAPTRRKRGAR